MYHSIKLLAATITLGLILTGCASQTVKATNSKINLKVTVASDVPNKIINADSIKEASLAKLKEKGIEQSDSGTPVTLSIFNFKLVKGGGNVSMTAGSTGFALVDALNTALTVAQNVDTVAKNVTSEQPIATKVDYKITTVSEDIGKFDISVQGKTEEQNKIYEQSFSNIINSVIK